MIRCGMMVEGPTEEAFVKIILGPHLAKHDVFCTPRLMRNGLGGWGRIRRRYQTLRKDIDLWLKQDHGADFRLTTMIDFYGLPSDLPGTEIAQKQRNSFNAADILEEAFRDDIQDRRFLAYIQMHEFEALLFSRPEAFKTYYPDRILAALPQLNAALAQFADNPEAIDDSPLTAPSKRLEACFPGYAKVAAGSIVAQEIGLERMRSACPRFDSWVTKLEALAAPLQGIR